MDLGCLPYHHVRLACIGARLVLVLQVVVWTSVDLHLHPIVLTHAGDFVVGFINVFTIPGELTADYSA